MLEDIEVPDKICDLFEAPHGALRYRGAYGGRGSGKSFNFAMMAALRGLQTKKRILCTRDFQNSIQESFYAELVNAIESRPFLSQCYSIQRQKIIGRNGSEFIFRGLRHNIASIKSIAHIDICIVEEAEEISEDSWQKLVPTIRAKNSEIWSIWNPRDDGSPTDTRFIKQSQPRSMIVQMNYLDNPFFPDVLEEQRLHDLENMDPNIYAHIWDGAYLLISDAQVLADKLRIAEFTPDESWNGPYHGLDFGFARDPTAGVKCWIRDNRLYVERESGGVGVDIDKTSGMLQRDIPGIEKYQLWADSARPESISYLRRDGLPRIKGCKKWSGSVEDGVTYLRSFDEIVVHPRCKRVANECRLYSYKVDRLSGQVLPVIIDKNNHWIDAIRYALGDMIKRNKLAIGRVGRA